MEEDFPTSPPKRRRTMSPEDEATTAAVPTEVPPPKAMYQPPKQADPAVKEDIERKVAAENNFLDVLMEQVEAQSTVTAAAAAAQALRREEAADPEMEKQFEGVGGLVEGKAGEESGWTDRQADAVEAVQKENGEQESSNTQAHTAPDAAMPDANEALAQAPAEREWETDSSPYHSDTSSDDSSSSDEDSDDDADDGDYAMLDPEEAARILMQDDGGSDDEGKTKDNSAAGLRTVHEQPDEVIPKPDITVTESTPIVELGNVEFIVENTVLVKAKTSGEYQVLESGSALCLKDRSVIGAVAETIGRVEEPMYTVRFANADAIQEAGVSEKGTTVYYVVPHSTFVFTQPLKSMKGSDASNLHDEEVGAEEMEFSDDEKEAEHKRQLKLKRQGRKDDGGGRGGRGRGRGGGQFQSARMPTVPETNGGITTLDYDDAGEGYTPLARPSNLHEMMTSAEPGEVAEPTPTFTQPRGNFQQRGGRGRGRGHPRGTGRGGRGEHRGGGRGGFAQHQQHQQQYPQPKTSQPFNQSQQPQQPPQQQQPPFPFPPQPPQPQYPSSFQPQPPTAPHLTPQQYTPQQQQPQYPPQTTPFSPSPISPLPPNPMGGGAFNFPGYGHQQQQPQPQFQNMVNMGNLGNLGNLGSLPPPPPPPPAGGFSFEQMQQMAAMAARYGGNGGMPGQQGQGQGQGR